MHRNRKDPSEDFIAPEAGSGESFKKSISLSAAAGLIAMVPPGARNSAWAGNTDNLNRSVPVFGIIPLTDCAPIVITREKGCFRKYGLNTAISKEASWANIRDKVSIGALDGAHMLAGMPISATLGSGRHAPGTPSRPSPWT